MPEYERPYPHLLDEIDRLRARLAEVEAERDRELAVEHGIVRGLRARLAAVLAVPYCRDAGHTEALHIAAKCCDPYESPCAAARGEDDRPAAGYQLTCAYCGAIYQPGGVNEPHFPSCKYSGEGDRG